MAESSRRFSWPGPGDRTQTAQTDNTQQNTKKDLRRKSSFIDVNLRLDRQEEFPVIKRRIDESSDFRHQVILNLEAKLKSCEHMLNGPYKVVDPIVNARYTKNQSDYKGAIQLMRAIHEDHNLRKAGWKPLEDRFRDNSLLDKDIRLLNACKDINEKYPEGTTLPAREIPAQVREQEAVGQFLASEHGDVGSPTGEQGDVEAAAPSERDGRKKLGIDISVLKDSPEEVIPQFEQMFIDRVERSAIDLAANAKAEPIDVVMYAGQETLKDIYKSLRNSKLSPNERREVDRCLETYIKGGLMPKPENRIVHTDPFLGSHSQQAYLGGVLGIPAWFNLGLNIASRALAH